MFDCNYFGRMRHFFLFDQSIQKTVEMFAGTHCALVICLIATMMLFSPALSQETKAPSQTLDSLGEEYFRIAFTFDPSWATAVGIHDYDAAICTFSKIELQQYRSKLQQLRLKLLKFKSDLGELNSQQHIEFELLLSNIDAGLLELDQVQHWRKDPDYYPSYATRSIATLISRNFAPKETRLGLVIQREDKIPTLLRNGCINLESTPRVFVDVALKQLPGIIAFFENDVLKAFEGIEHGKLYESFLRSNAKAVQSLKQYQSLVHDKLLPNSVNAFALGKESFQSKLRFEEMIDSPSDELLADSYSELHRVQNEFKSTAQAINPNIDAPSVFSQIVKNHPTADQLLPAVKGSLDAARSNCQSLVTMPSNDMLIVRETPPYMMASSSASMDAPGQCETADRTAYFQITLPKNDWPSDKIEQYLRGCSYKSLLNNAAHEAYPGHYVQAMWAQSLSSKIRKLLICTSNLEGWAHYCEQLMVERGPDAGDHELKLVQLHDALRRACRAVVAIRMHTQGMTIEQAKAFFMKEGLEEPLTAEREAIRGAIDPTYLVYTIGKLQILRLRDEFASCQNNSFNIKQFHDAFLSQGGAPVKLIREEVLKLVHAK